jgi:hypothetical protein
MASGLRLFVLALTTFALLRADRFRIKIEEVSLFEIECEALDLMQSVVSRPFKTNELRAFRVADLSDFPFR